MNKLRFLAVALPAVALAGCSLAITSPDRSDRVKVERDGGAYLGAGFNTNPPPSDTTQRGGAYLGAGF
jgi:hypothetical protein